MMNVSETIDEATSIYCDCSVGFAHRVLIAQSAERSDHRSGFIYGFIAGRGCSG